MPKEFIVAIELGSSKMTGIAGQKNLDGSITVLATVEEDSSSCIRKGVIYNIDKTCQCLTNIIKKLKNILKQDITQVYVGVGGRSIRSIKNVIVKDLPGNTIISQEMINELMDINRNMTYPDQEILDAATNDANSIRLSAITYTDDMMANIGSVLTQTLEDAGGKYKGFIDSLQSCLDVVNHNRQELAPQTAQAAAMTGSYHEDLSKAPEEDSLLDDLGDE